MQEPTAPHIIREVSFFVDEPTILGKRQQDKQRLIREREWFGHLFSHTSSEQMPIPCLTGSGPEFSPPPDKIVTHVTLIFDSQNTVIPATRVLPLTQKSFSQLQIVTYDDDHMLHNLYWYHLLQKDSP